MKFQVLILALGISVAVSAREPRHEARCTIEVQSVRLSGEVETRVFHLHAKSRAACKEAARSHQTNFAPQAIARKYVRFAWLDKEESEK